MVELRTIYCTFILSPPSLCSISVFPPILCVNVVKKITRKIETCRILPITRLEVIKVLIKLLLKF